VNHFPVVSYDYKNGDPEWAAVADYLPFSPGFSF
jgi:hypothetical protein